MSSTLPSGALLQAVKALNVHWQETKTSWRDAKSVEFEQKYLAPLPTEAMRAASAMKELDALLKRIRADCE